MPAARNIRFAPSALLVVADQPFSLVDLRVDLHDQPVGQLRDLWEAYRPRVDEFVARALEPDTVGVTRGATMSPRVRSDFPRRVRRIDHTWIPLADGTRLSARIWLPDDAERDPVPAILEYLPYRKGDGTAARRRASAIPTSPATAMRRCGSTSRQRRLRGPAGRRVPAAGARRRARGDRVDRRPALVHRCGRHDRHLLGRVQQPPGRGAAAARS